MGNFLGGRRKVHPLFTHIMEFSAFWSILVFASFPFGPTVGVTKALTVKQTRSPIAVLAGRANELIHCDPAL